VVEAQERSATIERLLQEGLDMLQAGMADHAVAAWTEVLHMQPDEPRALEYLRKAGVGTASSDEEPVVPSGGSVRAELEQLLAERRYEEALQLLYAARRQAPEAPDISRGIQLIKQRLIRRYLHQIGNLDEVPRVVAVDPAALADEEQELVRLADGISSFGDIAQESRLGRFETYRRLAGLVARGILVIEGAPPPVTAVVAPAPRSTKWLVGAVLAVAAAGIGVAVWQIGRWGPSAPEADGAATMAAATPPPLGALPDAAVAVEAAAGDAPVAVAAVGPSASAPDAAPAVEIEPPPPPSERKVTMRPPRPTAPPAPLRPAATARPTIEHAAPDAAPAAAAAPSPPPPQPPPEPSPPPAPPPEAPSGPLDATAATSALVVQGSLTRSVVERALVRIDHNFRGCYATAALRAHQNAATAVQVSLTIDETGAARDPGATGGALPGLDECVRDAVRRLHTEAPDVGVVHVTFTVTYRPLGP
jgi:hypothetical protein